MDVPASLKIFVPAFDPAQCGADLGNDSVFLPELTGKHLGGFCWVFFDNFGVFIHRFSPLD